jgi:type IV pilus assembly protein PilB
MKRVPIGQILVEGGSIDGRQLRAGLDWQRRRGGRIGSALVHLGMTDEGAVVRALGVQLGIPVIDLASHTVDRDMLRLVPARIIEERRVMPVRLLSEMRRGPLLVATSDPLDMSALDEVAFAADKMVRPALASRAQIDVAISRLLRRGRPEALDLPPEPLEDMELVQQVRPQRFFSSKPFLQVRTFPNTWYQ